MQRISTGQYKRGLVLFSHVVAHLGMRASSQSCDLVYKAMIALTLSIINQASVGNLTEFQSLEQRDLWRFVLPKVSAPACGNYSRSSSCLGKKLSLSVPINIVEEL